MSTYVLPSTPFETEALQGGPGTYFPTGGVGTYRVRVDDGQGATVIAATTAGIVEEGSAIYIATITAPSTAGQYAVIWDDGAGHEADGGQIIVTGTAPGSGLLCSVADVREYLQKPGGDTGQDAVILSCITRASRAIQDYAEREFSLTGTATRTFKAYRGSLVDLAPYDLQSASVVTDTPVGGTPATLTAGTDYDLGDLFLGGTYLYLRLGASYGRSFGDFPYSTITITGVWGMAAVPEDVRHACIVTAALWMRREVQAFSTTFNMDEARLERPEALPAAVRAMLAPYKRVVV